jgi:hypothetical protein
MKPCINSAVGGLTGIVVEMAKKTSGSLAFYNLLGIKGRWLNNEAVLEELVYRPRGS